MLTSKYRDVLSASIRDTNIQDITRHRSMPRTQEISMINDTERTFKNVVASGQVQKGPGKEKQHKTSSSTNEIRLFRSLSARDQGCTL